MKVAEQLSTCIITKRSWIQIPIGPSLFPFSLQIILKQTHLGGAALLIFFIRMDANLWCSNLKKSCLFLELLLCVTEKCPGLRVPFNLYRLPSIKEPFLAECWGWYPANISANSRDSHEAFSRFVEPTGLKNIFLNALNVKINRKHEKEPYASYPHPPLSLSSLSLSLFFSLPLPISLFPSSRLRSTAKTWTSREEYIKELLLGHSITWYSFSNR